MSTYKTTTPFSQVPKYITAQLSSGTEHKVISEIFRFKNKNGICYVMQRKWAEELGIHRTSIHRAIKKIIKLGIIIATGAKKYGKYIIYKIVTFVKNKASDNEISNKKEAFLAKSPEIFNAPAVQECNVPMLQDCNHILYDINYINNKSNTVLTEEFISFKSKLDKIIQVEKKLLSRSPKLRIKPIINPSYPIKKSKSFVKPIVDLLKSPKNLKQSIKTEQLEAKDKTVGKIQALSADKKLIITFREGTCNKTLKALDERLRHQCGKEEILS